MLHKKILVANAFSLSMLDPETQRGPYCRIPRLCGTGSAASTQEFLSSIERVGYTVESIVGHADTAALFSNILGRDITVNRATVVLDHSGKTLLVGQYTGPRLPEGATELPAGATITWWLV